MKLTEHKVLVTGGSTGIGLAIAKAFSELDCHVAICGREPVKLEKAKSIVRNVETIQCDLERPEAIAHLLTDVNNRLGGLSLLINNAAIQKNYVFPGRDLQLSISDVNQEVQINLLSLINLSVASLPLLTNNPSAAIVNMTSGLAITPKANAAIYCATKSAVHSFSCALRYQLQDAVPHIKLFEAMLPLVDTDMTKGRGKGKISPAEVVKAILKGMAEDKYDIAVGKVRALRLIHRLAPSLAASILRNG